MKKLFASLLIAVVILFSLFWVWRYVTLNEYYDSICNIDKTVYYSGEIVPFGEDRIGGYNQADGYSIRVNSFSMVDYISYIKDSEISVDNQFASPEKIALVYITLINDNSDAEGVMLTDLQLHGIDNYIGMDWDLLYEINPILQGNPGICLPHNTEVDLILPFDVYRSYFGSRTWRQLDDYTWYLRITSWPTQKDIQVQSTIDER